MILVNIKDCKDCNKSKFYGDKKNYKVICMSDDYTHQDNFKKEGRKSATKCNGFCKECETEKKRIGYIEQDKALEFMLMGNSIFILHSTKDNNDYIYRLKKTQSSKKENEYIYYVYLIKGDKEFYSGVLVKNNEYKVLEKNNFDTVDIKSLLLVLNKLDKGETVNNLEVYNAGYCMKCGEALKTVDEIENCVCNICKIGNDAV